MVWYSLSKLILTQNLILASLRRDVTLVYIYSSLFSLQLINCVQRILMNRRLQQQYTQQQQQQLTYQQATLSHLMMPKPPNLIMTPSNYQQIDMRGMYQSVAGGMQPPPLQRAPPPTVRSKNPGPSPGKSM